MSDAKIKIPGGTTAPGQQAKHQSLKFYFPDVEIQSYTVGTLRGAEQPPVVDVDRNDVVMTEFENGITWVHSGSEFITKLQAQQPSRGLNTGELVVPLQWEEYNAPSRGILTSGLKLLGINIFKKVADEVAGPKIAEAIAHRVEENNQNILYSCDKDFNLVDIPDSNTLKNASGTYLLLLHGTGSSTKGSFGGLINDQGAGVYKSLYNKYNGRIIAYEHKTFTQSPVQNIIELVRQLPDAITVDLLSHSRGGLLGELLARIGSKSWKGVFTDKEIKLLQQNEDAKTLLAEIDVLTNAIQSKQIKVNLFVRVACPAAGTTLVSDRADHLLNVLFNVLSHIPGEITSTIIEGVKALVTAVVNEKNNTSILPGIECMKPDSSFIKALNYVETKIDSDLIVIAGDAQGEGFINRLKMFLVDSFYREDNDLVVNTLSMKKGTSRTKDFPIYDERRGDVNHFHYFINPTSQKIISDALAGKTDASRGFYSSSILQEQKAPEVTKVASRSGKTIAEQPVLYVLPDVMGSHLNANNERLWLDYFKIAAGDLKRLKIDTTEAIEASGINGSAYRKLVDYFSRSHYVIPFAYDWRKSIFEAAAKLNVDILDKLSQTPTTISFIGHSMGGLVLRALAVHYPDTWKQLNERIGFRVLLLGTPHAGTYEVIRMLLGMNKSINALAALDLTSSKKQLLQQFAQYSGLLQLLPPATGENSFGTENFWKNIQSKVSSAYPIPTTDNLQSYLQLQDDDFKAFQYDSNLVKYIAGKDDQTPNDLEIDETNGKINFYATARGDGSVTWDSIPPELSGAIYYVNVPHGKLADDEASFAAYKELLLTGATKVLSTEPPITCAAVKPALMPEQEPVVVTDEVALSKYVMAIAVEPTKKQDQQIKISITHGDLGHALFPLIAGHFRGDGIVEAERILDKKLDHYLSIRHAANNYPGDIGTHAVIFSKKTTLPGAIIVGLGDFGELTENRLSQTIKQALLSYIIKCSEEKVSTNSSDALGVSCILIGSGFGGLTIYSSIKALLNAVKEANAFFEPALRPGYKRINQIEIIELYQYKAIQTGRIILSMILTNKLFNNIAFVPNTIKNASGAKNEIPDEMQTNWWHRLKISQSSEVSCSGKSVSRIFSFNSITDKARNEEKVLETNISIVDQLIAQAASSSNHDRKLCQTLYELLIPNEFKGYGADLRNIVLMLDKETARYPWEMMLDAYSNYEEPLVVKTGFIRQLSTTNYRENAEMTTINNVLVIGNPVLNDYYPNLPGAAEEARQVVRLLKSSGYNVLDYIEKEAQEAILDLYAQPFKIVHIAAHGVLKDKHTCQTGVVLGKEIILTPSDFKQMRKIPELVFVNCCSLGTINKEDEERLHRKYEVAAGIGTQLIEMGVKAVIVAGWEVDDEAALCFSSNFYQQLLKGRNFGDAVQDAREITYTDYQTSNTWGAYQCYGDPFYTLRITDNATPKTYEFCDPIEAVYKLQTLVSGTETATTRDEKDIIAKEIDCIKKAVNTHSEWLNNAAITEQLAQLYKELGNSAEAIKYFEQLFSMEDAGYTVKTVEQYCNVKIKQAVKDYGAVVNDNTKNKAAVAEACNTANNIIDGVINLLKNISIYPAANNTAPVASAERLNLIASAYRRKADVNRTDDNLFRESLIHAAEYYNKGYQTFINTYGRVYYYPLYNWLIISSIVSKLATEKEIQQYGTILNLPDNLQQLMQDAASYAAEADAITPDFWHKTALSMQYLLEIILTENENELEEFKNQIVANHQKAWQTEGSANKQIAISDHVQFIISMFEKYKETLQDIPFIDEKTEMLKTLINELNQS